MDVTINIEVGEKGQNVLFCLLWLIQLCRVFPFFFPLCPSNLRSFFTFSRIMKSVKSLATNEPIKQWLEERGINFSFQNKERKRYLTTNGTAALAVDKESFDVYRKIPQAYRVQIVEISPSFQVGGGKGEEWIMLEYEQGNFRPLDCSSKPQALKDPDVETAGDHENTFVGAITGVIEVLHQCRISVKALTVEAVEVPLGLYGDLEDDKTNNRSTFRLLPTEGLVTGKAFNEEDLRTMGINWLNCSPFWVKESRTGFEMLELLQEKKSRRDPNFSNSLARCCSWTRDKLDYPYSENILIDKSKIVVDKEEEKEKEASLKLEEHMATKARAEVKKSEAAPPTTKQGASDGGKSVRRVKRKPEKSDVEESEEKESAGNGTPTKKKIKKSYISKKSFFDQYENVQKLCGLFLQDSKWKSNEDVENGILEATRKAREVVLRLEMFKRTSRNLIELMDQEDKAFVDQLEALESMI